MVPWGPLHELHGGTSVYRPASTTKMLLNLIIHKLFVGFNPGAGAGPARAEEPPAQPRSLPREERGIASETVLRV